MHFVGGGKAGGTKNNGPAGTWVQFHWTQDNPISKDSLFQPRRSVTAHRPGLEGVQPVILQNRRPNQHPRLIGQPDLFSGHDYKSLPA